MYQSKAVIIGAGAGGLASAIRLAIQGFSVTVFEKNEYPGGKIGHLERNGFHFDTGPSLFTQPQNIEELFALAGEPIGEYLTYRPLPVSCSYFYEDGTILHAYADKDLFEQELMEKNGEARGVVKQYLQRVADMYQRIGMIFLHYSLHKKNTLLKAPIRKAWRFTKWSYLFRSMDKSNKKCFSSKKTVQLFNRYATYNGSDPFRAPSMLNLISHVEHNEGVFYPDGGMISIANALYRLALKKGVTFHFNTPVESIIRSNGRVYGVTVNGKNIEAGMVVSNVDAYFTYKQLLRDENMAHKIARQERSSSAVIFYWGMKSVFGQLQLHNIFFSGDPEKEFDHLFRLKKITDDPTVYVNITSKCEPGIQAPAGKENWFVMINAPADTGQDWKTYVADCRTAVVRKLNRMLQTDLEALIETEEILDPVLMEAQTSSYQGSLYGTSSNSAAAAFLRHPNFSKRIIGLYFVGGSVHPGGGIPLCLKSAGIMSGIVMEDQKKDRHSCS